MVLAWRVRPNGHSNQFSRKSKVKGSTKRVSRYECPLIRAACWIFFQERMFTGYQLIYGRQMRGETWMNACCRQKVKCYWASSFWPLWTSFGDPRSDIYPSHLGPPRFTVKIAIYRRCRHTFFLAISLPGRQLKFFTGAGTNR